MAEVKRSIKNEQLMFLNQIIREYPSDLKGSEEFKEIQEEVKKCSKDISACDHEECRLRSGILKPLARQIFNQVQCRFDLETILIRKHNLNYVQSLERLYAKESQTLAERLNQKNAESSPMIRALDQQIYKVTQEIKQVEMTCLSSSDAGQKKSASKKKAFLKIWYT